MAAYESLEYEQLKTSPLGQCIGTNKHFDSTFVSLKCIEINIWLSL